jgi:hypothetical protein
MSAYTYCTENQIIDAVKKSFAYSNGKTRCLKKGDNFFTVRFHDDDSYFSFEYCEEGLTKMFYKNGKISGAITDGAIIGTLIDKIFMELEAELRNDNSGEKQLQFEIHNKIVELALASNMMEN